MMITFRSGKVATIAVLLFLTAACSREQQDWRSAEGADTIDAYGHFLQRHPDSELATQARARVAQLSEDRDWQHAGSADTADAYRQFLSQHPNGKWAQEARIRIENFSLGGPPSNEPSAAVAARAESSGRAPGAAPPVVRPTTSGAPAPERPSAGAGTASSAAGSGGRSPTSAQPRPASRRHPCRHPRDTACSLALLAARAVLRTSGDSSRRASVRTCRGSRHASFPPTRPRGISTDFRLTSPTRLAPAQFASR